MIALLGRHRQRQAEQTRGRNPRAFAQENFFALPRQQSTVANARGTRVGRGVAELLCIEESVDGGIARQFSLWLIQRGGLQRGYFRERCEQGEQAGRGPPFVRCYFASCAESATRPWRCGLVPVCTFVPFSRLTERRVAVFLSKITAQNGCNLPASCLSSLRSLLILTVPGFLLDGCTSHGTQTSCDEQKSNTKSAPAGYW